MGSTKSWTRLGVHAHIGGSGASGSLTRFTPCTVHRSRHVFGWTENWDYLPIGTQVPFIRSDTYLLHIY